MRAEKRDRRSQYTIQIADVVTEHVVIALVGLPARGKSYISKAVVRYLCFLGVACKIFNAGNKRRHQGKAGADASFFDPANKSAQAQKEQMAMDTLEDMFDWLRESESGLACGIFDATNTTVARRRAVLERCARATTPITLVFLETVCDDEVILQQNYRMKLINDDYKNAATDEEKQRAFDDFLERVKAYEQVYEPITDAEVADSARANVELPPMRYLQTIDAGKKVVVSQLDGDSHICTMIRQLMHSVHLSPRTLYLVLCGESLNDRDGIRGGDTALSAAGLTYVQAALSTLQRRLSERQQPNALKPFVMAGTLRRYAEMSEVLREHVDVHHVLPVRALNELCFGSLEGLQGGRLRDSFPDEYEAREADKLSYRYPGVGGQSYYDLIVQMRQVLLQIESSRRDAIVLCDVAVARVLLGYFTPCTMADIPDLRVEPGLIELARTHAGFKRTDVPVDEGVVSMLAAIPTSPSGVSPGRAQHSFGGGLIAEPELCHSAG